VKADDATKVLGAVNPTFTATFSGFKNLETLATSGVAGSPSLTTTAITTSPVGTYPITAALGSLTATNYTFTFLNGTLTVQYSTSGMCLGDLGHTILQPINVDNSSVFKQKSTVPAKFRVCDANGVSIGTAGVVTNFRLIQTIAGTVADIDEAVVSTTPDNAFRWSPTDQLWIFNMNTKNLSAGTTYVYRITLNDASIIDFRYGLK
jgi:MBG domain (YGX type)